jgi:hypothetical protein
MMKSTPEEDVAQGDRKGLPIAMDANAQSTSADLPAFLAKPHGAPVYHGFRILDDVNVDGFTLGVITDFEVETAVYGDAFVVAPDGSRAGLVWEVCDNHTVEPVREETDERWGVWAVCFPHPMTNRQNAILNLGSVLPELKTKWEAWRRLHPDKELSES